MPELVQSGYAKNNSPKVALSVSEAQDWFANHVTLYGKPYTLDRDQVIAAIDNHLNTLVTARAGSGKTRVIVAKVAYLVAHGLTSLDQIAVFMFNRTAAAEVNERLSAIEVNGHKLTDINVFGLSKRLSNPKTSTVCIASTFHKFALDMIKLSGQKPQIITEEEQNKIIEQSLQKYLKQLSRKMPTREYQELRGLVGGFITRASQKYPGTQHFPDLERDVKKYCQKYQGNSDYSKNIFLHQIALRTYQDYLSTLKSPKIDFNLLMSSATELLDSASCPAIVDRIAPLRYLMIDEYQDFSYLFYALTNAIRRIATGAHLFAVGDDWQAINRFAGSDVDYFLKFANYFSRDVQNIPLATNYRSCRKIVEYANRFMLSSYDPHALPAVAFNRKPGKIRLLSQKKVKFKLDDLDEDALADGRYILALQEAIEASHHIPLRLRKLPPNKLIPIAKLLKTTLRILSKHPCTDTMLLHRHNFLSHESFPLDIFFKALRNLVIAENLFSSTNYDILLRCMTMHKSKGLEAEIVILLEMNRELIRSHHPPCYDF